MAAMASYEEAEAPLAASEALVGVVHQIEEAVALLVVVVEPLVASYSFRPSAVEQGHRRTVDVAGQRVIMDSGQPTIAQQQIRAVRPLSLF